MSLSNQLQLFVDMCQGHVRVGPDVVKDPAFLVSRNLEDFVTWVDTSKIKKHLMEYKELRDDFDMFC